MWERALRRAGLHVVYTEGFSPRPKMHFGLALSTGHESLAEYMDIDLVDDVQIDGLPILLTAVLPVGLEVEAAMLIDRSAPSLQADVTSCSWRFGLRDTTTQEVEQSIDRLLRADTVMLIRSRKGIEACDDVRPAIQTLHVREEDGQVVLLADIATEGRGLRPAELVQVLFPDVDDVDDRIGSVLRTHQWIYADGARMEPLPSAATAAAHAEVCA
jgi:radical SAM-linked protein